ncbi:hypothetical protein K1L80_000450 [Vibrio fluvialis]|nr:hypothetical protein [Vibrio fluvialis]
MTLKYEFAIYRDENDAIKKLYPRKLSGLNITQKLEIRELELYDEYEEYRLYPRFNEKSPHFYCKSSVRDFDNNRKDKSDKHDNRVKELVDQLNSLDQISVGYYTYDDDKNKYFETLVSLKNYTWGREIGRIIDSKYRVQHDVFGANLALSMSNRKPFIAIEVVKTHFLEKRTFEALLKLSSEIPLLVILDFTIKKNYYCQVMESDNRLRISHYIYNGSVWNRDKETKIYNQEFALTYFQENGYIDT